MLLLIKLICVVAVALGIVGLLYSLRLHSAKPLVLEALDIEIYRAERAGRSVGLMLLQLSVPITANLLALLSGKILSIQPIKNNVRKSDSVKQLSYKMYSILLTETMNEEGPNIVKERFRAEAETHGWQDFKIGIASYPEDGKTGKELFNRALIDANLQ